MSVLAVKPTVWPSDARNPPIVAVTPSVDPQNGESLCSMAPPRMGWRTVGAKADALGESAESADFPKAI